MIGHEIRTRREALGISQAELSRLSGVPQPRIAEYETGRREPTLDNLGALAEVLGSFAVVGGVRTVAHYRDVFSDAAKISHVGVQLLARAVYAMRHGHADDPDHAELADITREMLREHGESVSRERALEILTD